MNKVEVAKLLAAITVYDRFATSDVAKVNAWHMVLDDIDYRTASIAVVEHFKTNSKPIMPADIRKAVLPTRDPNSWMVRRGQPSWMLPPAEGWQDHHTEAAQ